MKDNALHGVVSKKKDGRPSDYTVEISKEICLRISNGRSVSSVCRDADMPSRPTFYKWVADNEEFLNRYREAVKQRAEYHFDEMLDIADEVGAEAAEIAKAKLQIDTRKWILSRMDATKYGDKMEVDNKSSDGSMTPQAVPDYSRLSDDELRQYAELESKAASDKSRVSKT